MCRDPANFQFIDVPFDLTKISNVSS